VLDTDERRIGGYAVVWGKPSVDLGGFRERFERGAFAGDLAGADVLCLVSHNTGQVLGRTASKTLDVHEDSTGLWFECRLPDTSYARDLVASVARGDVSGASFGFVKRWDVWSEEDGQRMRTIKKARLLEVSPTPIPAYPDTTVAMRSMRRADRKHRKWSKTARRAQLRKMELDLLA